MVQVEGWLRRAEHGPRLGVLQRDPGRQHLDHHRGHDHVAGPGREPDLARAYGFRFYAGAPVRDPLGFALGSVCVIDVVPRSLKPGERDALTTIADALSNLIRLQPLEAGQTRQRDKAIVHSP